MVFCVHCAVEIYSFGSLLKKKWIHITGYSICKSKPGKPITFAKPV